MPRRCELTAAALGLSLLTLAGTSFGLTALVCGTVIMSLGMAPVFTLGNEMIITAAPAERAGAAFAISETSSELTMDHPGKPAAPHSPPDPVAKASKWDRARRQRRARDTRLRRRPTFWQRAQ
jgi:hypothetical protein